MRSDSRRTRRRYHPSIPTKKPSRRKASPCLFRQSCGHIYSTAGCRFCNSLTIRPPSHAGARGRAMIRLWTDVSVCTNGRNPRPPVKHGGVSRCAFSTKPAQRFLLPATRFSFAVPRPYFTASVFCSPVLRYSVIPLFRFLFFHSVFCLLPSAFCLLTFDLSLPPSQRSAPCPRNSFFR